MENMIYTAAVLGSLCDDSADQPGIVASVLRKLQAIDIALAANALDEDKSGIDHTEDDEELMACANSQVERLYLACPVELFYNDELPFQCTGRLRLEIQGTAWDSGAPLYFN